MNDTHEESATEPKFPISVTFEDRSVERYESIHDLECNLEEFDSNKDTQCSVTDAEGRSVVLVIRLLKVVEFRIA